MTQSLAAAAYFCLAKGWWIFPLKTKAKTPNAKLAPNGVKNASNDPSQIKTWLEQEPESNWGIDLGRSNLTVLDVDSGIADLDAARAWCMQYQVPATFTVRTGRRTSFGLQLYFSGICPNKPYTLGTVAGEVRSAGYYVLAPGSVHPDSGEQYSVLRDSSLAPPPSFLHVLANRKVGRPQGDDTELIEPSFRHFFLIERARELFFAGLDGDGLEAAIVSLYMTRCVRDRSKDERIAHKEAAEIAQWIKEHPPEYPLQPNDFRTLRHAENDPRVKAAWDGQLELFEGSQDTAFTYLVRGLRKLGANVDQIKRIVGASPLHHTMQEIPDYIKNVNNS